MQARRHTSTATIPHDSATLSVDVVVPCYRYARYLRECVHSILAQPVPQLRVLILDDASPDETPEVAAELAAQDPRVSYRRHETNHGHIRTFNEGIEWVRADCMLLLSADDYLLPDALPRALEAMARHPAVGLCFGNARELHEDGRAAPIRVKLAAHEGAATVMPGSDFIRLCIAAGANNIVPTPTALVRSRLLHESGGYRPDLPHSGDLELWLRLAARGPVAHVAAEQAVYRRHAANMSLGYFVDEFVADLEQRRCAFRAFFDSARRHPEAPPQLEALYRGLLSGLADTAVEHASGAANRGRPDLARRLLDLAADIAPAVRRRPAWHRVTLKLALGPRGLARLLRSRAWLQAAFGRRTQRTRQGAEP